MTTATATSSVPIPDMKNDEALNDLVRRGVTKIFPEIHDVFKDLKSGILTRDQWSKAVTLSWKIGFNYQYLQSIQQLYVFVLQAGISGYKKYRDEAKDVQSIQITQMWHQEIIVFISKIVDTETKNLSIENLDG